MKITVASLDLFWLLQQAHLLRAENALEHFFSTRIRPNVEGLPKDLATSCYPLHYALRVMQRWPQMVAGNHFYLHLCRAFDYWLKARFSRSSDILAVLSGVGLESFREARKAGVITVVESGSTHPDFQHDIVLEEFRRNGLRQPLFPKRYLDRVRIEIEETDYIQIPSHFVGRTLIERGIPASKLLYATYGVDIGRFTTRPPPVGTEPFRVICPSGINLRKGARVLMEAWRRLGWKDSELHWIGSPGPETQHLFLDLPATVVLHPWLTHTDLAALYQRCDAFVLPSFEEGFARVMLEAAACGLPLIATPNTGVEDFFDATAPEGWLVPTGDVDALCAALSAGRADRNGAFQLGQRAAAKARAYSWEAYGRRVLANYQGIIDAR